jgi:phosphoribosylaminoimidazole carboxylase (NCAIR synthetase)
MDTTTDEEKLQRLEEKYAAITAEYERVKAFLTARIAETNPPEEDPAEE